MSPACLLIQICFLKKAFSSETFRLHNFHKCCPISHSPLAKLLFPAVDSNLLKFLYDDNQKVEPEWYIPIIPMVLVNGAEGIGTGWACKIPNYDPREIVNNINRMLNHQDPLPMVNTERNKSTLSTETDESIF